jgi:hypothetical protein
MKKCPGPLPAQMRSIKIKDLHRLIALFASKIATERISEADSTLIADRVTGRSTVE